MNSELIKIIHAIQTTSIPIAIHLCDDVINKGEDLSHNCNDINCGACPIKRSFNTSGKNFTTQMTLTMEAVNHETRNPTSD